MQKRTTNNKSDRVFFNTLFYLCEKNFDFFTKKLKIHTDPCYF